MLVSRASEAYPRSPETPVSRVHFFSLLAAKLAFSPSFRQAAIVFQIVFKDQSASEMKLLPTALQLQILSEFNFLPEDLDKADPEKFGRLEREGRKLFRYRTKDYRIYFERKEGGLIIYRVLHKNSLKDFLFRTRLLGEDEQLQKNDKFWELIDGQ